MTAGLVTIESRFAPKPALDRLEAELRARGIAVFARIDHAAGAAGIGMDLRSTEVLIFGNPKAGTPLMQREQRIGIDLPLKVLAWQDGSGKTFIAYSDPHWLAERHGIAAETGAITGAMAALLAELVRHAAGAG